MAAIMNRRSLLILATVSGFALAAWLAYHLATRPQVIVSFTSPDGQWRLVVRDVDPNPYQVTATYTIEDASGRAVAGEPLVLYHDSMEPTFNKPPTWTPGSVRINTLVARFDANGQTWSRW